MDEKKERLIFELISAAGTAKSCYMEAIAQARRGQFEAAAKTIDEGEKIFVEGHRYHAEMLADAANGVEENANLILVHAEDQMMSAETVKILAEEIIALYQYIGAKDEKE